MPGHDPHDDRVFFLAAGSRPAAPRAFHIPIEDLMRMQRCAQQIVQQDRDGGQPVVLRVGGRQGGLVLVALEASGPVLEGWRLAAIVEHRHGGPVLRAVSDAGARLNPETFAAARCAHCRLERRRARTFLLVHELTGEVQQVGSGCLADFTGAGRVQAACRRAEQLARLHGELERAERPAEGPGVEEFAAHATRVIRAHGFQPRDPGASTRSSAELALASWRGDPHAPDWDDRAVAHAALQWARTVLPGKPGLSEFERCAITATRTQHALDARERGLVCALIAAYRQRRARSRHQGQPGEWIEVTVLVEHVDEQPSPRYGTVHRCALIDHHANRLLWWQTTNPPLRAGELVHLRGQVAKHTHIADTRITVLTGCRPSRRASRTEVQATRPCT